VIELPFFEQRHRAFAPPLPDVPELPLDDRCRALVRELAAGGWLEHAVGELDVRTLCLARERLAYHDALADFAFAMQGLGTGPITLFGSDDLRSASQTVLHSIHLTAKSKYSSSVIMCSVSHLQTGQ